eukprot:c51019_g1_i1 orf=343-600(-)
MCFTEDILKYNPNMCAYKVHLLDLCQYIVVVEVPNLAKEASMKVIQEWGQPFSNITHLIFYTTLYLELIALSYNYWVCALPSSGH